MKGFMRQRQTSTDKQPSDQSGVPQFHIGDRLLLGCTVDTITIYHDKIVYDVCIDGRTSLFDRMSFTEQQLMEMGNEVD